MPEITTNRKPGHELTEKNFENFLPSYLRTASRLYFTPIDVARKAAEWLTQKGAKKILDIGAGVGKFCIAGAYYTNADFYGIEHRISLSTIGTKIAAHYGLSNVQIINGNILEHPFSGYDGFYLYNPFYENLEYIKRLNDEITLKEELYQVYLDYTEHELNKLQPGTRLVTYHGNNFEVPDSYTKDQEAFNGELKLWIKEN